MKQILNTLYVQTQGAYLRLDHDTLKLEVEKEVKFQIPLHHLGSLVVFGNVLLSPFLIQRCGEDGRAIVWLTQRGSFKGRLTGRTTGNVLLRQVQYEAAQCADKSLDIARYMVAGKLQNARKVVLRAAREAKLDTDSSALRATATVHADSILSAKEAQDIEQLRGVEGYGAKAYFGSFTSMVRTHRETFKFCERSKRPPKDPINALLSFVYTLIANECVAACEGVGLDPQMGFLHAIRPGRPALALDLMEEFRAPFGDRLVLTLVNRNQIKPKDFETRPGGSVYMTDSGRKTLLTAYQKRKQDEVPHGVVGAKVSLGLIPHVQARLLARHLRGDVPHYQPFVMQG